VEANSTVSTESESGNERSIAVSSPVIKVYGSVGVEATLKPEVETTELTVGSNTSEAADRRSPYEAWATGRKSEANGARAKGAPVSGTIGTEAEVVAVVRAGATTVGAATTVAVATEVVDGVAEAKGLSVGPAPIRETIR